MPMSFLVYISIGICLPEHYPGTRNFGPLVYIYYVSRVIETQQTACAVKRLCNCLWGFGIHVDSVVLSLCDLFMYQVM